MLFGRASTLLDNRHSSTSNVQGIRKAGNQPMGERHTPAKKCVGQLSAHRTAVTETKT